MKKVLIVDGFRHGGAFYPAGDEVVELPEKLADFAIANELAIESPAEDAEAKAKAEAEAKAKQEAENKSRGNAPENK